MKFRPINEPERDIITRSLSPFISGDFSRLRGHQFYMSIHEGKNDRTTLKAYLVKNSLRKSIQSAKRDVAHAGIYFGRVWRGRLLLSIEGTQVLHEREQIPREKYLKIDGAGEKSVLYGNAIKKEWILDISKKARKDDMLAVLNPKNELIALARLNVEQEGFKEARGGEVVAKNLVDKGIYLRIKQ